MDIKAHEMVALFDYDSLIYKSCYRIVDIATIREWFELGRTKSWMREKIIEKSVNRLSNMGDNLFLDLDDVGVRVEHVEYFITAAKRSARKEIDPLYKSHRRPNKWVNKIRKHLLEANFAITSDEFEADDLIFDRAMELGDENCIILTMDKDLKQIPGIHFDYYRPTTIDQEGNKKRGPCRGLELVSPEKAQRFFWYQMLTGDHGDFIKGVPGIGPKRAAKMLDDLPTKDLKLRVMRAYYEKFDGLKELINNYYLLKLGTKERDIEMIVNEFESVFSEVA